MDVDQAKSEGTQAKGMSSILQEYAQQASSISRLALDAGQAESARHAVLAAAHDIIRKLEKPAEQLARIGWEEPARNAAIKTALDLDLPAKFEASGTLTLSELTESTACHDKELMARIMQILSAHGLASPVEDNAEKFQLQGLLKEGGRDPDLLGGILYSYGGMIPAFHHLPEFLNKTNYRNPIDISEGPFQFGLKTEQNFFGYLEKNKKMGANFNHFMRLFSAMHVSWVNYYPIEADLLSGVDPGKGTFLVDVGSGLGHETFGLLEKFPNVPGQLILQDQPSVIEQAKSASKNISDNISFVIHNFFEPQPESCRGARVYFMRLVLHDWPDAESKVILKHIRNAMTRGYSKILINETVLNDLNPTQHQTGLDWTMMAMLASKERSETQWKDLLESVGLRMESIKYFGPESVITAVLQ